MIRIWCAGHSQISSFNWIVSGSVTSRPIGEFTRNTTPTAFVSAMHSENYVESVTACKAWDRPKSTDRVALT